MMLQIIVYTIAVAASLSVVALFCERLARLQGLPRRFTWLVAMHLSILLPAAMILGSRPEARRDSSNAVSQMDDRYADTKRAGSAQRNATVALVQAAALNVSRQLSNVKLRTPSDGQLIAAWVVVSSAFGLYLFGANLRLRRRANGWQRTTVFEQDVLVSAVTGPALLGVLRPRIVVPQWLLLEPAATQALILKHEQQHMAARDPVLMAVGLFAIAAVPWNLPLWWQWRRLRQAIELDCDARVLRAGTEACTYAEVLLGVTKRAARMPAIALAMSEPVAALERRIENLMPDVVRHATLQKLAVAGLAAAGVSVVVALNAPSLPARFPVAVVVDVVTTPAALPATVEVHSRPAEEPQPLLASAPSQVASVENNPNRPVSGEISMNRSKSISVAVAAVSAAVVAQAQAPSQTISDVLRAKAEKILANNDLNKDGTITREEAAKANQPLFFMWSQYDINGDGKVVAAEVGVYTEAVELGTAVNKLGGSSAAAGLPSKARPEAIIANNDQNNDGIVTREEAQKSAKALFMMWDIYDLDKDGKVDAAEITKASAY